MDTDKEDLILLVLKQGGRRDAIKLYQEETGVRLAEARLAVEDLASRHGAGGRGFPAVAALILLLLVGIAGTLFLSGLLEP